MNLLQMSLQEQAILVLAALVLFLSFLLLAQTRILPAIHAFAWQSALVALTTALSAWTTGQEHLYLSALLTLVLKAFLIPWMLQRLVFRLDIEREVETIGHPILLQLLGAFLVGFSYWTIEPVEHFVTTVSRDTIAVSLAVVLLGLLIMVSRRQAVVQVLGFMSIENGLFFAAVVATYGMPMVVELGIAFDVLVAAVLFGIFFFHIRENFDSLDVDRLNRLAETEDET